MKLKSFYDNMKEIYNKKFSKSRLVFVYGALCNNVIFVDLLLSQDNKECSNGIVENDMFKITFEIKFSNIENIKGNNDIELDNTEIVFSMINNGYMIKPKNQYLYCEYKKVPFRKIVGNTDKVLQGFEKFVTRLYNSVKTDLDNDIIHSNFTDFVKTKI